MIVDEALFWNCKTITTKSKLESKQIWHEKQITYEQQVAVRFLREAERKEIRKRNKKLSVLGSERYKRVCAVNISSEVVQSLKWKKSAKNFFVKTHLSANSELFVCLQRQSRTAITVFFFEVFFFSLIYLLIIFFKEWQHNSFILKISI